MSTISAASIQVAYDQKVIIDGLDCQLAEGKITTIIGSNGCGKSTLLKAFTRILPTKAGSITLDGQSIALLPTKEVAQKIALLPQTMEATDGITVYDLVSLMAAFRIKLAWAGSVQKTGKKSAGLWKQLRSANFRTGRWMICLVVSASVSGLLWP